MNFNSLGEQFAFQPQIVSHHFFTYHPLISHLISFLFSLPFPAETNLRTVRRIPPCLIRISLRDTRWEIPSSLAPYLPNFALDASKILRNNFDPIEDTPTQSNHFSSGRRLKRVGSSLTYPVTT
ncbi:hypothetical protein CDAR_452861 [Caerostris darwini]|uniref:Uncharacterized protein n=1 Tax=Caerostris darwini TaxID=1538125 RepID=A0AAV4SNZ2_9ARAC|nr:hypothetical protein CDAR_452861 [Caerostris darwini]